MKINVDASVLPGAHAYSVGMVLRDSKGQFVRARNSKHAGEVPVFEAEARGVLEALKWIHEMQLVKVDIETDSFLTFQALDRGIDYNLEVGDLLVECRDLLNDRPDLLVCFVKRQANAVAHLLAKAPCMVDSHNVFMSPPNFLLETLLYDSILIE